MKKLIMTMLIILGCGASYALPIGNPADASLLYDGLFMEGYCPDPCDPCLSWWDAFSFRFGFYGDYVFDRHLEVDGHNNDPDIDHTKIYTNAGFLALNIWNRIDLFATLGATNLLIETNGAAFNVTAVGGPRFVIETDTHFSWSVGLRGTIFEFGCTSFGAEAQYFYTRPDIFLISSAAATTESVYPDNIDMKYQEWQIGIGISHRINILVPYIGVKWSRARADFDQALVALPSFSALLNDIQNKKLWGYAVGISLVDCEKTSLAIEGRWGDEKAVYVNSQIRF